MKTVLFRDNVALLHLLLSGVIVRDYNGSLEGWALLDFVNTRASKEHARSAVTSIFVNILRND